MKPLQIAADRDRLGETRPVVELQHGHSAGWVLCEEFRGAALTSENIDILQRKLDSFFRREDANPARIWSYCMIVKLHCISHFEPSKTPRDDFIRRLGPPRSPKQQDAVILQAFLISIFCCLLATSAGFGK